VERSKLRCAACPLDKEKLIDAQQQSDHPLREFLLQQYSA
jgi:hypothetical protein